MRRIAVIQDKILFHLTNFTVPPLQMKSLHGVKMSYRLQELIQGESSEPIRGIRVEENNVIAAANYIYSLIRANRGQRRALCSSMLNMFDDTAVSTE